MSIKCTKFVGYSADVTEEWNNLREKAETEGKDDLLCDKWLGDFASNKQQADELIEKYNFLGYYNSNYKWGDLENKFTVVYDGMNGEYTKLFYVIAFEEYAEDEKDSVVDAINELLKGTKGAPVTIREKMMVLYNEIFSTDGHHLEINAEFLVHYH